MVTNFENLKMNIRGNDPQYVFSHGTSVILSLEFHGDDVLLPLFVIKLKMSDYQLWMQATMQQLQLEWSNFAKWTNCFRFYSDVSEIWFN